MKKAVMKEELLMVKYTFIVRSDIYDNLIFLVFVFVKIKQNECTWSQCITVTLTCDMSHVLTNR